MTRQIIKIEELIVNQERMSDLESRMEKMEQLIRDIDKAIFSQIMMKTRRSNDEPKLIKIRDRMETLERKARRLHR